MDTIERLKTLIDEHDLNCAEIAREIGFSKERFHYLLNNAKSCPIDVYAKIRRAIENRGVRVDDLDTMSITGLAAYLNSEASKLVEECIRAMEDGCISTDEKMILKSAVVKMRTDLDALMEKL